MSHAMPALLKADNLKLLFMVILAITLAVIVKARFFGQRSVDRPSVTPTRQEAPVTTEDRVIPVRTQVPDVQRHPVSAPGKTETDQPTAPSTLHRDLFAPADSAYDPFQLSRSAQEPIGADDLELRATIMDTGGALAIINDQVLRVGDTIQGAKLISVSKNQAVLSTRKGEMTLNIQREDIQ